MADLKAAGQRRGSQLRAILDKACVVDLAFLCDTTGSMAVSAPVLACIAGC